MRLFKDAIERRIHDKRKKSKSAENAQTHAQIPVDSAKTVMHLAKVKSDARRSAKTNESKSNKMQPFSVGVPYPLVVRFSFQMHAAHTHTR